MSKQFGYLCPDGHGLLLGRDGWASRGVVWCGHEDHGGNGRFFRISEVQEGIVDSRAPIQTEDQQKRMRQAALAAEERRKVAIEKTATIRKRATRKLAAVPDAPAPVKAKGPRPCECECGGMTKGGRFIPGHDAKLHARLRAEAAAKIEATPDVAGVGAVDDGSF